MNGLRKYLILLLLAVISVTTQAQNKKKTRILFLLDGSGSMWGMWENEQKIVVAKRLLTQLVDSLGDLENVELALRAYGHRSPKARQDCKDTRLEVPFGVNNKQQIIEKLKEIRPKGTTPIAYSLSMAANDFPKAARTRNIIILITDGIEECGGDPCAVSLALQQRKVMLKPFIIGLNIDARFADQLDCVGNFFNATEEKAFGEILNVVISNALNNTTTQINLLDSYGKPTETDANMTFYDIKSGMIRYNFYHTLNSKGLPDTLFIDPLYKYNITVHTIPPVYKDNVELVSGKHNTIAIDAPQGYLKLKINGITNYLDLQALVKKQNSNEIIHVQHFNTTEKYLTGKYDLEILTLPRLKLQGIEIKQSHTNTIEVPQPGKLNIFSYQYMRGSIYKLVKGKLVWITEINPEVKTQVLVMQPGEYRIVYKRKDAIVTLYTSEKKFTITSGGSTNVNLR